MAPTESKQLSADLPSSNGTVAGKRIQVPNIVCQFESKKHPCDLYKECLDWYKNSKSSLHESTERFESFYEWSCFAFPNISKEMLFWTINLTNCMFDLDDYVSCVLPDPNFTKYYQLSRIVFRCTSLPTIQPESICPAGYNVHNAAAMQETLRNIKQLASASWGSSAQYADFLVRDWEEWFQNQYYARILKPKFGSVEDYVSYRSVNVACLPYANVVMLGLGYNFPMEIFLHKYVVGIKRRTCAFIGVINDVFSYNREIKTEPNPYNILMYASVEYATDLMKQWEDEVLNLIEKVNKEEWVVEGKDYKSQVVDYCENMKYVFSGTLTWSKVATRYRHYNNEVDDDDLHNLMGSTLTSALASQMKKLTWKNDEKILDYGCGTGHMASIYLLPKLEETNSKLYGVDISKTMIEHGKANFINKHVQYFTTTLADPDFQLKNERFDKIFSIGGLQFDNLYKETIGKMFEVLVPGGQLILALVTKSCAFDALQYVKSLPDLVQQADNLPVPDWVIEGGVDVRHRFEILLDQIGFRTLEAFTKNESHDICSEKEWANWLVAGNRGSYELSLSEDEQKNLAETMHRFMLNNKVDGEEGHHQLAFEMLLIHAEKPASANTK